MYYLGLLIGGWVGRALVWVFANKLGTILVGSGLAMASFTATSYIVGQVEDAIAQAFGASNAASYQGVAIGVLAWQMFKLAGGGDAAIMIVAAYAAGASIAASKVFLKRLTA